VNDLILHLIELRKRLIQISLFLICLFLILFWKDEDLYTFIAKPLLTQLPLGSQMIATEVTSTFMVPMKLAFVTALILSMPFILYQLWAFAAPGLYKQEKRTLLPFLISSIILFYLGIVFAFYVICPMTLGFFASSAPIGIVVMTDIRHYLDFVLTILFSSGIAFQVPVITLALIQAGLVTAKQLSYLRPYVIVGAFVVGMILTPPDVISQILLALPMWGLFEGGLLLAKFLPKPAVAPAQFDS